MSHEKLHQEAIRWYRQGLDDLEAAQALDCGQEVCPSLLLCSAIRRKESQSCVN